MSDSIMHPAVTTSKGLSDLEIAKHLWDVLDNIDTALDAYKPEMKGFAGFVANEVRKRHMLLKTDGYNLTRNDK